MGSGQIEPRIAQVAMVAMVAMVRTTRARGLHPLKQLVATR
eukprot:COSAG04_NODE_32030_length_253_cov_0.993506_2_plen_40_part_01